MNNETTFVLYEVDVENCIIVTVQTSRVDPVVAIAIVKLHENIAGNNFRDVETRRVPRGCRAGLVVARCGV